MAEQQDEDLSNYGAYRIAVHGMVAMPLYIKSMTIMNSTENNQVCYTWIFISVQSFFSKIEYKGLSYLITDIIFRKDSSGTKNGSSL